MIKLLYRKSNGIRKNKLSFRKFFTTEKSQNCEIENFLNDLKTDEGKSWEYYIKGINPDYEPRKDMYNFLISKKINVHRMTVYEVECFTKWLLMRKIYGNKFPRFPYEITFEDKIEELKEKYPLQ
ncbi:hypothetical protein MKS88_003749 [Plasmodium brasilianum]|uniref:Uncharacterized protein n=2 Tax=Plasmodium (Plasmodium) TaxID=418103 RepID=A0A1A8W567_PLAMA|nr:conserved Plasmodium protein, unknown function [Plasmodium malariae]KAI4837279.1 hypothetical protein MKS88_003749 [Plasmodium brasilianum]SBS87143.1 conserved Plasmodium protein, unknown function [Plasmodium malariae]SBT79697.1 conserved Plasmodium protein, unknown function [Plasmodium malariae]SCO93161.1 conserved Plasmodium protein, unknown function [Plasmodium malariae]